MVKDKGKRLVRKRPHKNKVVRDPVVAKVFPTSLLIVQRARILESTLRNQTLNNLHLQSKINLKQPLNQSVMGKERLKS